MIYLFVVLLCFVIRNCLWSQINEVETVFFFFNCGSDMKFWWIIGILLYRCICNFKSFFFFDEVCCSGNNSDISFGWTVGTFLIGIFVEYNFEKFFFYLIWSCDEVCCDDYSSDMKFWWIVEIFLYRCICKLWFRKFFFLRVYLNWMC